MALPQPPSQESETGLALGLTLIAILGGLLVAALMTGFKTGPVKPGLSAALTGMYIMAWGAMFLASYFFEKKTFFFRALIWVCENLSHPKGREMAFFYAALCLGLGGFGFLRGLDLV